MVKTLDNITRQARQGSVAAIIQVLNAELAESGVRARAVLSQGMLQILCEADTSSKLNRSILIDQLQATLNSIQPRYVRRVRVNTRLVSEQQLLWLDEIERDPDGQLLWTAEFGIQRPRLGQQLRSTWSDWREQSHLSSIVLADTAQREKQKRRLWQVAIGGSGLLLFLGLVGWVTYDFLGLGQRRQASPPPPEPDTSALAVVDTPQPSPSVSESTQPTSSPEPQPSGSQNNVPPDPFVQAVRIAEQSVIAGQTASTSDEWIELAAQWQRAAELMDSVPADDTRYATAQNRTTMYLQNSVDSRRQAELADRSKPIN
ncbi:MAG: hypothetical protein F6K30_24655 [Cyanothece sp. SIO2G6]|nr:hypothetical protein [Cyanothece sp. SIO2G6]